MVREFDSLSQRPGELRRSLFSDGPHMLVVWWDDEKQPVGFQLIYETAMGRYVMTQQPGRPPTHNRLDEGGRHRGHAVSPMLARDGAQDIRRVLTTFLRCSHLLDRRIRLMITRAMRRIERVPWHGHGHRDASG